MPFLMLKTTAEDSLFWKKSFIFANAIIMIKDYGKTV